MRGNCYTSVAVSIYPLALSASSTSSMRFYQMRKEGFLPVFCDFKLNLASVPVYCHRDAGKNSRHNCNVNERDHSRTCSPIGHEALI